MASLFRGGRKLFWLAAVVSFGLDQWTKFAFAIAGEGSVVGPAFAGKQWPLPGILWFVKQHPNTRGVFGMGPQSPLLYAVLAAVGLLLIFYFLLQTDPSRLWPVCALGLIAGGAMGNLVDRMFYPGVRDFIRMIWWPFAYNVADAAICAGVAIVVVHVLWGEDGSEEDSQQTGQEFRG